MKTEFLKKAALVSMLWGMTTILQATPVGLQVEFMKQPLGIDVDRPRFSWRMDEIRYGASQSAYRLMVATSEDDLRRGRFLWDTGKLESDKSVDISYQGESLRAKTRYYWQVTVWDERGTESTSAIDWFETGLLGTGFGNAQWIGSEKMNLSKYRSSFNLSYDYELESGSTQAAFVFGAQDEKNYIKVLINGTQMTLSSTIEGKETKLPAEDISSLLSNNSKHRVTLNVDGPRGYNLHISIDGQPVKNTHRPQGGQGGMFGAPDEYRFSIAAPEPDGRGINGRLYQVGFAQPQGQNATFSNIQIGENAWESVLYNDSKIYQERGSGKLTLWQPGEDAAAPMLRKKIEISKPLKQARLYATARGIYEFYINGQKVGHDYLNPGWTDYRYRIMYNTFDITDMLKQGANGIGAMIGAGWYSDMMGFNSSWQDQYGIRQSLLAMIELRYADGSTETIVTDKSWKCFNGGPIVANSLFNGEDYDARREVNGWTNGDFNDNEWEQVAMIDPAPQTVKLQGYVGLTIQNNVTLTAQRMTKVGNRYIYDMGQNLAGVQRLSGMKGKPGQTITIHFAEMLYPEIIPEEPVAPYTTEMYQEKRGDMYLDNYRSALSTDHYTFKGSTEGETYEPRFTSHGFRYISIEGLDAPLALEQVQAVVLESIGEQTSSFETSNADVNRLFENAVWGQRGNFLSVPTDCPQRDERMGWTGDAQVFARAATYNMNIDQFYTRWFYTVRDDQGTNGSYGGYYPDLGIPPSGANSIGGMPAGGWREVGVIVPWQVYQQYGDLGFVEQHYDSMVRFMDYLERSATNYIQPFGGTGDWLAPVFTNTMLTNTCYAAYAAQLMEQMAQALGKAADAKRFHTFYENIKRVFNETFVNAEGYTQVPAEAARQRDPMAASLGMAGNTAEVIGDNPVIVNTQTSYVLPLQFGLFSEENKPKALKHLIETIRESNYCLTTGFVGTPYICLVLSDNGYPEEAYKLFLNNQYPSWLFPVKQGATTFWERWNSYTVKNGFGPVSMNSFNHYAYGAIEEWMMSHCLGIQRDEQRPGYKHILLQPEIGEGLDYAQGGFLTMYGEVKSAWKKEGKGYTYQVTIPANTTASLQLQADNEKAADITVGKEAARVAGFTNGKIHYELPAGTYEFIIKK